MTQKTQSAEELNLIEELAAFAQHSEHCDHLFSTSYPRKCDCGLDEILARLAPTPATSIEWFNPDNLTQEQLEPDKGYRFAYDGEFITEWEYWGGSGENWGWRCMGDDHCAVTVESGKAGSTRRVKAPLPSKYAHLEEAKAFAARSAFAAYKLNEGERLEWRGKGWWKDKECDYLRHRIGTQDTTRYNNDKAYGVSDCYYAEIIRDETAEDVAKRLLLEVPQKEGFGPWVFEGIGPVSDLSTDEYLIRYHTATGWQTKGCAFGNSREFYFARARKLEPELVPFDQESWPVDALWVRHVHHMNEKATHFLVWAVSERGIRVYPNDTPIPFAGLLRDGWEYRAIGQTWRKCGREAR
jgi:hypothetical protein